MNAFIASDEMNVLKTHIWTSATHMHTQQLPVTFKQDLFQDDCYSQVLITENGQYHALVLMHLRVCYYTVDVHKLYIYRN